MKKVHVVMKKYSGYTGSQPDAVFNDFTKACEYKYEKSRLGKADYWIEDVLFYYSNDVVITEK